MNDMSMAVWQRFLVNAQRRSTVRELDVRLHRCAATRDEEGVRSALLSGADPNAPVGKGGRTALHEAVASSRSVRIVAVLVEHGGDVDAVDGSGSTVLHLAAQGGCCDCVEFLLRSAAEPDVPDNQGWTAAQAASRCQVREARVRIRAALRQYTTGRGGAGDDDDDDDDGAGAGAGAGAGDGGGSDGDGGADGGAAAPAVPVALAPVAPAAPAAPAALVAPGAHDAPVAADAAAAAAPAAPVAAEAAAEAPAVPAAAELGLGPGPASPASAAGTVRAGGGPEVRRTIAMPAPPPPPAAMVQRMRELEGLRAQRRAMSEKQRAVQLQAAWLPAEPEDALAELQRSVALVRGGAFSTEPRHARMFILKSFTEDDVHKAMKYGVWTSLPHSNAAFSAAWEGEIGPVYFLFSVNKSGRFVGLAQMDGPLSAATFALWAKRKFMGHFKVKWLFVHDLSFDAVKHVTLPNNEGRSMVWSRDGQEVPLQQLHEVLGIWAATAGSADDGAQGLLADWAYYEQREQQMRARYQSKLAPSATDSSKRLLRGAEHGPRHGPLFRHGQPPLHGRDADAEAVDDGDQRQR